MDERIVPVVCSFTHRVTISDETSRVIQCIALQMLLLLPGHHCMCLLLSPHPNAAINCAFVRLTSFVKVYPTRHNSLYTSDTPSWYIYWRAIICFALSWSPFCRREDILVLIGRHSVVYTKPCAAIFRVRPLLKQYLCSTGARHVKAGSKELPFCCSTAIFLFPLSVLF
jgi:hypothetical protein